MSSTEQYSLLQHKISALRRKENLLDFYRGLLVFFAGIILLALFASMIENFFVLTSQERWPLVLSGALVASAGFSYFCLLPLARYLNFIRSYDDLLLCGKVGRAFPEIRDRLGNALSLYMRSGTPDRYTSSGMLHAFVVEVYEQSRTFDFTRAADVSRIRKPARFLASAFVLLAFVMIAYYQPFMLSMNRLLHPGTVLQPVIPFAISIDPGDCEILYGQTATLSARIHPLVPDVTVPGKLSVFIRPEGVDQYREETVRSDSAGRFTYSIANCRQSFMYYAEASTRSYGRQHSARSGNYTLTVVRRPSVKRLQVELNGPSYSKTETRQLEDNAGDIAALRGTKVKWTLVSTKPLRQASVVFQDSSSKPMRVSAYTPYKAEGEMILMKSGRYHFELTDTAGIASSDPIEYPVTVFSDEYPVIRLIEPDKDFDINETMLVAMTGDIQDDFGFTKLSLNYKLDETRGFLPPQEQYMTLDLSYLLAEDITQSTLQYTWNLEKLNLQPEDVMSFYLEVFDNDRISGPKASQSAIRRLRFPSLSEMFAEANQQQNQVIDKTEDLIKAADEIKKETDELNKDLLKNKKLDWKDQEKAKQLIEKQQKIQENIRDVQKQVQELSNKLSENKLISKETLDKYQELQKLLSEIYNKDFQEMMQKLQQSMKQNLDQRQMKEAMKQLQTDQESLKRSLDRTVELLKRIKVEQMFDQLKKETDDLIRRQEQIQSENAKNPSKETRQSLSKEQERAEETLNKIQKQSEDLKSMIRDIDKNYRTDELDKTIGQMKSGKTQGKMQKSSQSLSSNPSSSKEEKQNQESISEELDSLSRQMKKARDEYQKQQNDQVMSAMRKIVFDLLELSRQQEALIGETRSTPLYSSRLQGVTQKQGDIRAGLSGVTDQLAELSNQTFFVTSTLGKTVGKAVTAMNESIRSLEDRSTSSAAEHQNRAMVSVNDAVKLLMQSMNRMQQGQSGTGLQQMMDELRQMAGQQGKINEGTIPFSQGQGQEGNEGQMSLEQQAALARMMAEQQALRDALEQMGGQLQGQESLKGQLGNMAREMDEVIRDMKNRNVGRETIRRQQQILQRMLDASRSMREKEFSEKRKGETAKDYLSKSPGGLPDNLTDRKDKLRRDLMRSMKEGFAKDYEELIRLYFEALGNIELKE